MREILGRRRIEELGVECYSLDLILLMVPKGTCERVIQAIGEID